MFKLFSAIKIGYEVISAILAVQAGGSYALYPEYKGVKYKVVVEMLPPVV